MIYLLVEISNSYSYGRGDRMRACGKAFAKLSYHYSELAGYLCSHGYLGYEVIFPNLYRSGCL